jgi:hypothetical protein
MTVTYKNDDAFLSYVAVAGTGYGMYPIFQWMKQVPTAAFRFIRDTDIEVNRLGLQELDELYPGVNTFAIVMNPWLRAKFSYLKIIETLNNLDDQNKIDKNKKLIDLFNLNLDSFESFVRQLPTMDQKTNYWFTPITPQVRWVEYDANGEHREVTYILRAENIIEDFKPIQDYFCTNEPLVLDEALPEYREYYTDETRNIIGEIFAEDIKRFSYIF